MDKKKLFRELESFQETQLKEEYKNLSFTVVLVQPESAGNIGSLARIMKNFNFKKLIIFNPIESRENIVSHESQGFAMHAKDILLGAEIIEIENDADHIIEFGKFIKQFDLVLATTAKGKRYTNVKRLAIFPQDLTIPASEKPLKIAILLGKESRGLTNEEVELSDINLRIPTGNEYPTLNLSHAGGIILYEIFKKINVVNIGRGENPVLLADKEDRVVLYRFIDGLLEKVKTQEYKKDMAYDAFKNIFERAIMSKKELSLITGLFSKLDSIMKDREVYED